MEQDKRIGNQFWKLRSKHGRDKIFESGEMIIQACDEYMECLEQNPLQEHDFVGKDAREVNKDKKHVPTWAGFATFCNTHKQHFNQLKVDYKNEKDEIKKDIYIALMRVDDIFFHDKFSAASAGLANPNLIGKDLGLKDSVDVTTLGEKVNAQTSIEVTIAKPKDDI